MKIAGYRIFKALTFAFLFILGCQATPLERTSEQYVQDLHRKAFVADLHNDLMEKILEDGVDIGIRNAETHLDIPKMEEGGIDFLLCAAWSSPNIEHYDQSKHVLDMIDAFYSAVEKNSGKMGLALNAQDVRRLQAEGKIAVMMSIEGGHAIESDMALLRTFYRVGVRAMTLTWMNNNEWADASSPDPSRYGADYYRKIKNHGGLTDFGKEVVREMNRLGMVVDVSHTSDKTTWDVLETTSAPIIASHSSAYAVAAHNRNINDELLKAIAQNGGVVGVNFYPPYIDTSFNSRYQKELSLIVSPVSNASAAHKAEAARRAAPPLALVIEHINHMVKVAGIDHVGLGSDFDGIDSTPRDLEDGTKFINLTRALVQEGYSDEDIYKIMGGNALRVIEEVTGK